MLPGSAWIFLSVPQALLLAQGPFCLYRVGHSPSNHFRPTAGMDPQLEECLRALHDGSTPPDVRRRAHEATEQWKNSADASGIVQTVGPLIGSGNTLVVRHFGFHTLEHLIQWRWTQIPGETREVRAPLFVVRPRQRPVAGELTRGRTAGAQKLPRAVPGVWYPAPRGPHCAPLCAPPALLTRYARAQAEQAMIKEKSSRLVAMLAVREWPQRWPTLIEGAPSLTPALST
jgi:hypothetical protein